MKFKFLLSGILLVSLGVFVFAQGLMPLGFLSVSGPYSVSTCFESDGGLDIYSRGFNVVQVPGTNGSIQNLSGFDSCSGNQIVTEVLCGNWINQNFGTTGYNNSLFLVNFNCSASNTATQQFGCVNGACVVTSYTNVTIPGGNNTNVTIPGGNNTNVTIGNTTNLTLPDLTISSLTPIVGYVYSGGNIVNVSFAFNLTISNIGNSPVGPSSSFLNISGPFMGSSFTIWPTPGMGPGASITIPLLQTTFSGPFITPANFTINVMADGYSNISEINENNNNLMISVTI